MSRVMPFPERAPLSRKARHASLSMLVRQLSLGGAHSAQNPSISGQKNQLPPRQCRMGRNTMLLSFSRNKSWSKNFGTVTYLYCVQQNPERDHVGWEFLDQVTLQSFSFELRGIADDIEQQLYVLARDRIRASNCFG